MFWQSMTHSTIEEGIAITSQIATILQPRLEEILHEVCLPIVYFVSKSTMPYGGLCPAHRDSSIFDEHHNRYRNIWIPLVDTDITNGTLFVLPRSHKFFTEELPAMAEWPYGHFDKSLQAQYHTINAKAGDLVVYLDNAIHGSYENTSAARRPVIHGGIIHNSSKKHIQYQLLNDSGEIEIYAVDIDFFVNKKFTDPDFKKKYTLVEQRKYDTSNLLTLEKFEEFYSSQV